MKRDPRMEENPRVSATMVKNNSFSYFTSQMSFVSSNSAKLW